MNFNTSLFSKPFSIALGSFAGLATLSSIATAAPTSALNPCPGIYYEEPHNSQRIVPEGCPPNAATRLRNEQGQTLFTPLTTQTKPIQPPLPEEQQTAITTITLQSGQVNVRLRNKTNTPITYQVIGHTQQRTLAGGEEVALQELPAPVTITFLRPDGGLIRVIPVESSEQGTLVLMLNAAMGLNDSQASVRIQSNGKVFAY
jgi:hypothetical protein